MAIIVGQIPSAILTVQDLQEKLNDIKLLLTQAKSLSDNGWQVDIGSRFPIVVTVSPAQQAAMVASYDSLKSALVTTFQQLP